MNQQFLSHGDYNREGPKLAWWEEKILWSEGLLMGPIDDPWRRFREAVAPAFRHIIELSEKLQEAWDQFSDIMSQMQDKKPPSHVGPPRDERAPKIMAMSVHYAAPQRTRKRNREHQYRRPRTKIVR